MHRTRSRSRSRTRSEYSDYSASLPPSRPRSAYSNYNDTLITIQRDYSKKSVHCQTDNLKWHAVQIEHIKPIIQEAIAPGLAQVTAFNELRRNDYNRAILSSIRRSGIKGGIMSIHILLIAVIVLIIVLIYVQNTSELSPSTPSPPTPTKDFGGVVLPEFRHDLCNSTLSHV